MFFFPFPSGHTALVTSYGKTGCITFVMIFFLQLQALSDAESKYSRWVSGPTIEQQQGTNCSKPNDVLFAIL
jgi:hypothetical protein